jgi:hypothetical protein
MSALLALGALDGSTRVLVAGPLIRAQPGQGHGVQRRLRAQPEPFGGLEAGGEAALGRLAIAGSQRDARSQRLPARVGHGIDGIAGIGRGRGGAGVCGSGGPGERGSGLGQAALLAQRRGCGQHGIDRRRLHLDADLADRRGLAPAAGLDLDVATRLSLDRPAAAAVDGDRGRGLRRCQRHLGVAVQSPGPDRDAGAGLDLADLPGARQRAAGECKLDLGRRGRRGTFAAGAARKRREPRCLQCQCRTIGQHQGGSRSTS